MKRLIGTFAILALLLSNSTLAQSNRQSVTKKDKQGSLNLQAAAASNLTGSGTPGRLSKWVGTSGSNTFVLGDSNIFEDKFGKVGIGTITPTSLLTVQGMIETTMGGYKFPDGTIQSTAFSAGQVVSSLNGLKGDVILAAGANITITPFGNTLTITAPNALNAVVHDTTLQGNGTSGSPLGLAIPLNLTGSAPEGSSVLTVVNTGAFGTGVKATGGDGTGIIGGDGAVAAGGNSDVSAGVGVRATGGDNSGFPGDGGTGVLGIGGSGAAFGGSGVEAVGATGGSNSRGGMGLKASGGSASGAGNTGGDGIFVFPGQGSDGATDGLAGRFLGTVLIAEDLNVTGTKNFKIDHPLDPENKYLIHAAVESSEVLNIYSGNVTTNEQGEATVTLPDWFEALNRDFRYQLTSIGAPAQSLYVAEKINKNRFKIAGGQPGMEVSWQVTGVRSDAVMLKHQFKSEENKPESERGTYLSPEAFNQPEERSAEWARYPQTMQQLKQRRIEAEQTRKTTPPNQR